MTAKAEHPAPWIDTQAIARVGIDKSFGAVHADTAIDLKVARRTIHGIRYVKER